MARLKALRNDDLLIPQGTTYRVQWPITDAEGDPLPLSGYTARSQARRLREDTDTLVEWTTENGGIILADSTVTIVVDPTESTAWLWRCAYYDVELVSSNGSVTRITQGEIKVDPEVTR